VARAPRDVPRAAVPSTVLLAGPPGVGKSWLAETFARETGLPALRLDGADGEWARAAVDDWAELRAVADGLAPAIVILDGADRLLAGHDAGERAAPALLARIARDLVDASARGRALFVLTARRPDRLLEALPRDAIERVLAVTPPAEPGHVEAVLVAQLRKHGLASEPGLFADPGRAELCRPMIGLVGADLEALLLRAAALAGGSPLKRAHLTEAARDALPTGDPELGDYAELAAAFAAGSRRLLPRRHAGLSDAELAARRAELRARLDGTRRA
jgi:SpoVK/Ycf46/Vps4 family AAA+-type ATPase